MINLDDLKLNDLLRIDDVCDLVDQLADNLSKTSDIRYLCNRQDVIDLLNRLVYPVIPE